MMMTTIIKENNIHATDDNDDGHRHKRENNIKKELICFLSLTYIQGRDYKQTEV
jgi:hypothetical protein